VFSGLGFTTGEASGCRGLESGRCQLNYSCAGDMPCGNRAGCCRRSGDCCRLGHGENDPRLGERLSLGNCWEDFSPSDILFGSWGREGLGLVIAGRTPSRSKLHDRQARRSISDFEHRSDFLEFFFCLLSSFRFWTMANNQQVLVSSCRDTARLISSSAVSF
jgi:hypothetical protein